jgi:hypothetical protein
VSFFLSPYTVVVSHSASHAIRAVHTICFLFTKINQTAFLEELSDPEESIIDFFALFSTAGFSISFVASFRKKIKTKIHLFKIKKYSAKLETDWQLSNATLTSDN